MQLHTNVGVHVLAQNQRKDLESSLAECPSLQRHSLSCKQLPSGHVADVSGCRCMHCRAISVEEVDGQELTVKHWVSCCCCC
jgi:hypothetical protein